MDRIEINSVKTLKGEFSPPSDKSISHRAVMFNAVSTGRAAVRNVLRAKDTMSTMNAFRALGVEIEDDGDVIVVNGRGLDGLREPSDVIDCGNSGTTIRLISGVLSGNPFFSVLTGDSSLRSRPMARVIKPLSAMGAEIRARDANRYPPMSITGGGLKPITYEMPMASAQVKSSVLLAGLYAEGETTVVEPAKSRDHTEKMLPSFGADLKVDGLKVTLKGRPSLSAVDVDVPADFSSAAFFLVAAAILPGSEVVAQRVCINPTRTGLLEVLGRMGADIEIFNQRNVSGETVADIVCRGRAGLKAVSVGGEIIPSLIDEFPILCIAAACADGVTEIRDAEELRVKESDRIKAMSTELRKMGLETEEHVDGLSIRGGGLKRAEVESHGDHRIAMAMAVAGLASQGGVAVNGASAVEISFPGFFEIIRRLAV